MNLKIRKTMKHCQYCPQCAGEMEWREFYYYCPKCNITQFPYSYKAIIGVAIIGILTFATLLM